jgi:hypothetical protein
MDVRPTLGGKNWFHDFSLPNRKELTKNNLGQFFREIVKQISWKDIGRMSILQNSSLKREAEKRDASHGRRHTP